MSSRRVWRLVSAEEALSGSVCLRPSHVVSALASAAEGKGAPRVTACYRTGNNTCIKLLLFVVFLANYCVAMRGGIVYEQLDFAGSLVHVPSLCLVWVQLLQVQANFPERSHTGSLSKPIAVDKAPVTSTCFHLNFSTSPMSKAREFPCKEFCSIQEDF